MSYFKGTADQRIDLEVSRHMADCCQVADGERLTGVKQVHHN